MYEGLRTNLPAEVMRAAADAPFDSSDTASTSSFVSRVDVQRYLDTLAADAGLTGSPALRCGVRVRRIVPLRERSRFADALGDAATRWRVEFAATSESDADSPRRSEQRPRTKKARSSSGESERAATIETLEADAVLVANGHYSRPRWPSPMPAGADTFRGELMHARDVVEPERQFAGKRLLCVGAGPSGRDVTRMAAANAAAVFLAHRASLVTDGHATNGDDSGVQQCALIERFDGSDVLLADGQRIVNVDCVVFCTGYDYDFPFFDDDSSPVTVDVPARRISPLYRHLVAINNPSLALMGICYTLVPFPHMTAQARYLARLFAGCFKLPDRDSMLANERRAIAQRKSMQWPARYAHKMGMLQFEYYNELAAECGSEPHEPALRTMYEAVSRARAQMGSQYRDLKFEPIRDESLREIDFSVKVASDSDAAH